MFSQIDEETMKEFCMCIVYMERLEIIKRAER